VTRIAPLQALLGIGGLLVALWALMGGPELSGSDSAMWIALAVAVGVGLILIFSGGRDKKAAPTTSGPESAP
jgi:purine-cytosine permease-like protein